ncbi:MAG: hypothetical protein Ta2G_01240 [Termitinemataceae bacterium]|nr:MAG: hypothetical protein Ta2G_01240 [Termitinemataceae bacterium]
MRKEKCILWLLGTLYLTGQFSLFAAENFFEITSKPTGADVIVYDKDKNVVQKTTTPANILLNGKLPVNIEITKKDYVSQTFVVKKPGKKNIVLVLTPEALARPVIPPESDFKFIVTDDGKNVRIMKYMGSAINIIIPSKMDGLPVTELSYQSFSGNTKITKIVIPNTVTNIKEEAFKGCRALVSVEFEGANKIEFGDRVFEGCPLGVETKVSIRDHFIQNEYYFYLYNPSAALTDAEKKLVTEIKLKKELDAVNAANAAGAQTSDFKVNINKAGNGVVVADYHGLATIVKIPDSFDGFPVTEIGGRAFSNNEKITSVELPKTVKIINDSENMLETFLGVSLDSGAFYRCSNLSKVVLPNGITKIGDGAFAGCYELRTIIIPNTVNEIGAFAFVSTGITSITIPNSVTTIERDAFSSCSGLTTITIPNNIRTIEKNVFWGCKSLTSVTVPNSVRAIKDSAFWGCTSLTKIEILGDSQIQFGKYVFNQCPLELAVGAMLRKHGYTE